MQTITYRALLGALLVTGCTSHEAATPGTEPTAAPTPPELEVEQCALQATAIDPPVLHRDLLAVAPQYFHPFHHGGFDAYRGGGQVFPWFDAHSLHEPFIPPVDVRIAASTRSTLLAVSSDGVLGVLARGGGAPTWLGERLYPEDAVETKAGVRWVLARSGSTWRLVRIDAGNAASVFDLDVPESTWDVRIALTSDDRIAAAWLERDGGVLRVKLTLDPAAAEPRVVNVDEVALPEPVATLSQRSRVDLALAGDGPDGVAIAWRPLTDAGYADVGDRSTPPTTPCGAEVRWRVVSSEGKPSGEPRRHPTLAQPLGGVSGIGPWGLTGNGMKATRIGGRAAFVWLDDGGVLGARADHEAAVVLAPREQAPLIVLERDGQLLLLDSSPGVSAFSLGCG